MDKAGIREVAKAAGVSISTVSRAFAHPEVVSEKTRHKVLQAAGRVIRTPKDRGVVLLIDDRFVVPDTRRLMPPHWEHLRVVESAETLAGELERFWGREASPEGEAVSGPAR